MVDDASARSWLDRYVDPQPIRTRSFFHVVSARRAEDGRACVVVVPGPASSPARVREAFGEIARVHALVHHPLIPEVAAHGVAGDTPFLEFACDAVLDGVEGLPLLAKARKISHDQGDAFVYSLREAIQAAHAVTDPSCGTPICIGRLSLGNLLFAPSGRWYLIGFGRNFPVEKDDGCLDRSVIVFAAPELTFGAPPSPSGDYVALNLFMRSFLSLAETHPTLVRILRGEITPADGEIFACLRWFEERMVGVPAPQRASVPEAVAMSERLRFLLGGRLDREGFSAAVARACKRHPGACVNVDGDSGRDVAEPKILVLGPEVAWFEGPGGERHRLRHALRRILATLVEQHRQKPAAPLTVWSLLDAGWPGERPQSESGANRVYVSIARLRSMGLRDVIERFEDGYRIAPSAMVRNG